MIGREGERVRSYVSSIMSEGTINGDKVLKMKLFALMIWLDILIRRRIIDKYYIDCSLLNGFCKLFLLCDVTSFELILIFILNVYTMFHFSLFEPVTFPRIKKDAYIYIHMYIYVCVSWKVAKVHQDASRNSDEWKFGTQLVSKSPVFFFYLSVTETNWNSNRGTGNERFLFFLWNVSLISM